MKKSLAELVKQLEKSNDDLQAYIKRFPIEKEVKDNGYITDENR